MRIRIMRQLQDLRNQGWDEARPSRDGHLAPRLRNHGSAVLCRGRILQLPLMLAALSTAGICVSSAHGENLVQNGSFENSAVVDSTWTGSAWKVFSNDFRPDGWNYDADSVAVGWVKSKGGTWFANSCETPDGGFAVFFNQNGRISQENIVVDEAGVYAVSFRCVSRGGSYKDGVFYVEIDGTVVGGGVDVGSDDTLFRPAERRAYLEAGTHTLAIRHSDEKNRRINNNGGACSCIDAVSLQRVNLVRNGSFENSAVVDSTWTGSAWKVFSNDFRPDGWNYDADSVAVGWVKSKGGTWFANSCETPDGGFAVFFNQNGRISQENIVVDEAGVYAVSFRCVSRGGSYKDGVFYVEIDGTVVGGGVDVGSDNTLFRYAERRAYLEVGTHTLAIRHSDEKNRRINNNGGACSCVDAVSLQKTRVEDLDNLVQNGSFEVYNYNGVTPSGWTALTPGKLTLFGWDHVAPVGMGLADSNNNVWFAAPCTIPDGDFALFFNQDASVTQQITVDETGLYVVGFDYISRGQPSGTERYQNGLFYLEIDNAVVGRSIDVGAVRTVFRTALWQVPLEAGSHTLTVRHSSEQNVRGTTGDGACSSIDAVFVRKTDNLILNGNFDFGMVASSAGWAYSSAAAAEFDNPHWTVSGYAGLAKSGAAWVSAQIDSGVYSMYTQTANYTMGNTDRRWDPVSISQAFDVQKPGVYALGFSYASRPSYAGGKLYVRVRKGGLAGEIVWEKSVTATSQTAFQEFAGTVRVHRAGTYTLEFYAPQPDYITGAANDLCCIIDNVSLRFERKLTGLFILVD